MPRLSFATLRGFLKGFIDLVFEHDGRYFILDWKSNHLGDTPAHYGQAGDGRRDARPGLSPAVPAVPRWRSIATCAGASPNTHPERHLGGAVYLFVRGVQARLAATTAGAPTGVFFTAPVAGFARANVQRCSMSMETAA